MMLIFVLLNIYNSLYIDNVNLWPYNCIIQIFTNYIKNCRGGNYMGVLGSRALDIIVSERELCLILGYLASPGRIGLIEAQIPEDKSLEFERAYPGVQYYPITQGITTGGHQKKQGHQFRIYLNNTRNCPTVLIPYLKEGLGSSVNRINRGKFIEKIIENYNFVFGEIQDSNAIRNAVLARHPRYINEFDAGFRL